ncbi:GMC oxidoreductase-domain-containing protein [Lasiosphaeria ovina]|uniref:GMC oxidoreductase-domain-containing protein n=1 Tax=Lasiosphaeria ovina TaxID=92902 RepID=A0AAE0JWU3_9PEZI|nr:GMC oxidoreductase-domain-containing protein [Lasiosphaeria ovina]
MGPEEMLDGLLGGRANPEELIRNQDKILGWNGQDVTRKVRPSDSEVAALGPVFQEAWDRDFKHAPNRSMMIVKLINVFLGDLASVLVGQYLSTSTFTVHPYSRGHIHITGPELGDAIDFETGFFLESRGLDIKKQVWAYKKQREVVQQIAAYRASCCARTSAPPHSLGTCKMGPYEKRGVVDARLGVEGLKIADLSVLPGNVTANTNNTALAFGEKAADIFIKELGLGRVVVAAV